MKTTILAACVAAALSLPAFGGDEAPERDPGYGLLDHFEMDIDLDLVGAMLAQASEEAKTPEEMRKAEREKARIEKEKAHAERDRLRAEREKARIDADVMRIDMERWARDFEANMEVSMGYMFADRVSRSKVVKGAPYSADIVTETNQTLPDGNVITHRNVNRVYRDGEGRTRQEHWRSDKLRSVYITDPVEQANYTLIPSSKAAVISPRIEPRMPKGHERPDVHGSADAHARTQSRTITRIEAKDGEPGREEVRVQVVRIGEDGTRTITVTPPTPPTPPTLPTPPTPATPPTPPTPPIPGIDTMRFESTAHLGRGTTTTLPAKQLEGIKAEGKSTVWTIPAGKIGNKNPINVTSETWYSPDLQVTLYTRHHDPRTGESIYRLADVKRAEPQADLFRVPADYKVRDRRRKDVPDAKREASPG